MASGLTYQFFVIFARFSTPCHGRPSFWDFSALFTLGLAHLWTFRTCGNTTCEAFVFPWDKVMHCMILGWKTDMMGLMLVFQSTMPFKAKIFLDFHTIWPNTSLLPCTKINYRISCPITIHCRTPNKASQTCWPCQ